MSKPTPYPYQAIGVNAIRKFNGRALLADEMGLGKSMQVLWYLEKADCQRAVIVVPASLKVNWQREARKVGLDATLGFGRSGHENFDWDSTKILVLNYDILKAWLPALLKWKPDLMVLDECHYVQSRTAQRTKAARSLARKTDKLIAVSGTPLTNRPSELWSVLNMLDPTTYPTFGSFANRYCRPKLTPWGWDYSGAQNLKELHTMLSTGSMLRRLKAAVLKDLPKNSTHLKVLPLSDPKEYEKADKDFANWLGEQDPEALRRAMRAMAVTRLSQLKRLAGRLKLKPMLEYFDNLLASSDRKIVVSACHHEIIDALMEHFGESAVKVDGRMDSKARDNSVRAFMGNKNIRVFVGQLQAAGVGLTLTVASDVYFAEMGWSPGDHTQMADRVHRIGQDRPCTNTYLVAEGTIEEDIAKLLQEKTGVVSSILDGEGEIGDSAIYTQLMEKLTGGFNA